MSKSKKKFKPQKQKQNILWLLVALGGVFLILAVFFSRTRDRGGTPSVAVDQQKIDYGDVKFGVEKSFAITVTNTGDGNLRFKEAPYVEVLEGC